LSGLKPLPTFGLLFELLDSLQLNRTSYTDSSGCNENEPFCSNSLPSSQPDPADLPEVPDRRVVQDWGLLWEQVCSQFLLDDRRWPPSWTLLSSTSGLGRTI
jgi:hypothetical protein